MTEYTQDRRCRHRRHGVGLSVLLAEAGHDIWAVDGWQDHVDAINSKAFACRRAVSHHRLRSEPPPILARRELATYIIATKASGAGDAAGMVASSMRPAGPDHPTAWRRRTDRRPHADGHVLLGVADGSARHRKGRARRTTMR